ncbi:MAG: type II toxin-antitoxin system HicA family toxin [Bacteroidota bacterium]
MSRKEKLLLKLLSGNADGNFAFDDLVKILIWFGFEERRTTGSHQIFCIEGIEGIINLQRSADNKAKSYQVKQVRDFLVNNKLVSDE